MRLDQYATEVTSTLEGKKMKVAANGKTFSLLLDRLYTDIKLAIVREMLTNGFDSHMAAGRADVPLKVTLPSKWDDSVIRFRDYGTSMSEELVDQIYNTLMSSTKDDSDDAVGGWGIGSKTPLGYVKEFTLKCFMDGKVRVYQIWMDHMSEPNLTPTFTGDSDEPEGCEVSFKVERADIESFKENIKLVTKWFDVPPAVTGMVLDTPKKTHLVGKLYKMETAIDPSTYNYNYYYNKGNQGLYVRQGCVAYPLDGTKLKVVEGVTKKDLAKAKAALEDYARHDAFLDVPVGTADVTASRDALYYSDKTIKNVIELLCEIYEEVSKVCEEEFNKATTLYEARRSKFICTRKLGGDSVSSYYRSSIVNNWFEGKTFDGKTLDEALYLNVYKYEKDKDGTKQKVKTYKNLRFAYIANGERKRINFPHRYDYMNFTYEHPVTLVVDQINAKTGRYTKLRNYRMAEFRKDTEGRVIWCEVNSDSLDGFNKFREELGNPPVVYMHDIDPPAKEDRQTGESSGSNRNVYRYFLAGDPGGTEKVVGRDEIEEVLDSETFYFIETFMASPLPEYNMSLKEMASLAKTYVDSEDDTPVLVVTKTNKSFYNKHIKDKQDFIKLLKDKLKKEFNPERFVELSKILDYKPNWHEWKILSDIGSDLLPHSVWFRYDDTITLEMNDIPIDNEEIRTCLWHYYNRSNLDKEYQELTTAHYKLTGYLDEDARKELQTRIDLAEKTIDPDFKYSMLTSMQTQLLRTYPWLESVYGDMDSERWIKYFNEMTAV